MIELVKAGRSPKQLAREFNCSASSICNWVAQRATDEGSPPSGRDVLTSAERDELARLRRENRQLKAEREILAKATAWFAGKGDRTSIESTNS
jgi:transposase